MRLTLALLAVVASAAVAATVAAEPRFAGLERLYFDRLEDPGLAVSGLRRGETVTEIDEEMRRLLPPTLGDGEGPIVEERVIEVPDSPLHFGLQVRDFPLPGLRAGGEAEAEVFLRQVVDGTHPRIHEQFWALYAGATRTDLWFFSPTPERTDSKLLAPIAVEAVLASDGESLVLRASGAMIRPHGAGWLQGADLLFAVEGEALRYRYAVRRYSFTYGYDLGEGRGSLVGVEVPREEDGRTVLEQRLYDDAPPELERECGIDPEDAFPAGGFDELVRIATCITSAPGSVRRRRASDEPSWIERGGRPTLSADPPSS